MSGGIAARLYRGEAGVNVVGRRKVWFMVAGIAVVIAIAGMFLRGFTLGIEFEGGNQFSVPVSAGTLDEVEQAFGNAGVEVKTGQTVGDSQYIIKTELINDVARQTAIKDEVAEKFGINPTQISDSAVSTSWGGQVTDKAALSLAIFLAAVLAYLVFRFEWRMAAAAIASLLLDLVLTAGVYALVGFEVTPSTVIGFLTILGFALYDVVVVFDKVQENTKGITGSNNTTYSEAANLAVNQTLMRSINTGLVALLPVGGLLFIGAGLLGAGTLKDLGLVLFIGMGVAVYSSIFFATPVLAELKSREPRLRAHAQRVAGRRAALAKEQARAATVAVDSDGVPIGSGGAKAERPVNPELAGAAPRPGARPAARPGAGKRPRAGGRPGGGSGRR
ncbi:protein translocase subunit SecF [Dactylosporangium sp. AC04546]|uniref:protein translocase subunit SecF n=1 Tax=Dactylosporangium sp. AC04546 TaxID=2862460 RepID=UPI001EDF6E57|nr:protein translocase subunit SecF [Dactylosporangium sp. AC04546]WVK81704.1 protein translocase subunit SecF [Dactylosporangium sp. AC04546]